MTNVSLFVDFCFVLGLISMVFHFSKVKKSYISKTQRVYKSGVYFVLYTSFLIFVMTIVQMGTQCRHVLLLWRDFHFAIDTLLITIDWDRHSLSVSTRDCSTWVADPEARGHPGNHDGEECSIAAITVLQNETVTVRDPYVGWEAIHLVQTVHFFCGEEFHRIKLG